MTLKTRNLFIKIFLIGSLFLIAISLVIFFISLHNHLILTPPDYRIPDFLNKLPFTPKSFVALMISFLLLLLYVPVCFYLLIRFFENTQTTEIIFFTGFLIACLTEISRFIAICLGLWQSFTNILIFSGNIVLFGRTLAPLSFLCAALLSETSQRQDIERNYIIMMTVSVVLATVIPMNTAKIASTGLVTEGFMQQLNIGRLLLLIVTFTSFFLNGIKKNSPEYRKMAISSALILLGYSLLVTCDNFLFLILGTAALAFGTFRYLKVIHAMYMWS